MLAEAQHGVKQKLLRWYWGGSLTFHDGPSLDLFIPAKGGNIWMIQTNPDNVFQGTATKMSH